MNRLLPVAALVLSCAALAVSLLGGGEPPPPPPPPTQEEAPGPTRAELEAWARRVEALEVTTLSLARRAAALERGAGLPVAGAAGAPAAAAPADAAALAAQVEQLKADVQGLVVGEAMTSPGGREQLKLAVQAAQADLVRQRFEARVQQAAQERQERLQRFAREARLSSSQERELTALLDAEAERTRELRAQGLRGQERREALRSLRSETDAAAARVLDTEQRAAFEQLRREERAEGGGRPRGRETAAPSP